MIVSRTTQMRPWRRVLILLALAPLAFAPAAFAGDVAGLVFFGDSLSDTTCSWASRSASRDGR
jgi:phospholipase/lecithinase/hemolysin